MARTLKSVALAMLAIAVLATLALYVWLSRAIDRALIPPAVPHNVESILDYRGQAPAETPSGRSAVDERASLLLTSDRDKPWTRWWWPGADVEVDSLIRQLDAMKAAGFGGVEIQPFSLGLTRMSDVQTVQRVLEFDTPRYYQILDALMTHAGEIGMQVYLNHLSGWPAGGPHVPLQASMHEYLFAEERIEGGRVVEMALPEVAPGLNAYAMALFELMRGFDGYNFARGEETLVSVVAAKPIGGKRSWNPLDGSDTVILDPSSVVVLDDHVDNGVLRWEAPSGEWLIVATYLIPSGEPPILVASKQSGYVIDHLDPELLIAHYNYAFGQRTGLDRHYGRGFSGFFNDSLEYKLDVMSSADMLDEFQARQEYDLRPYLPLLAIDGGDNFYLRDAAQFRTNPNYAYSTDIDDRIRHDFLTSRSEMIIERFISASSAWAAQHGLNSRAQSYGFDLDVIRALGANHIPETEQLYAGGSEMFLKMASSAGELYGRNLVSAESFVWKGRDYAIGPKHLKAATDLLLHSGINQIIYHGMAYQTQDQGNHEAYVETFGDMGWFPWSQPNFDLTFSLNAGPVSPLWKIVPDLNQYITRSQALLRQGQADVDLYIYYPFMGIPTSYGASVTATQEFLVNGYLPDETSESLEIELVELPFFTPATNSVDTRIEWLERLQTVIAALNSHGITWRFINDHAIQENLLGSKGGSEGSHKPAILVFDAPALSLATAQTLNTGDGVYHRVLFMGTLPQQVPGYKDYSQKDAALRSLINSLSASRIVESPQAIVDAIESRVVFSRASTIRRHSRTLSDGREVHFFTNQSLDPVETSIQFPAHTEDTPVFWFDPVSGNQWQAFPDEGSRIDVRLAPLQSIFVLVGETLTPTASPIWERGLKADWQVVDTAVWSVVADETPVDTAAVFIDAQTDERLVSAAKIVYRSTLQIDGSGRYLVDLGDVDGVAQVMVNDVPLPTPAFPPYTIDITDAVTAGENSLLVEVRPPLRNKLVALALSGEPRYTQHLVHQEELTKGGLKGPVRLGQVN